MATFVVVLNRTEYSSCSITIEADSASEAEGLALCEAGNLEYSSYDADYEVSSIGQK